MQGPVKCNKGHKGVGQQETREEPDHVGVVVDPGQQPNQDEDHEDCHQFTQRHPGRFKRRPHVQHLHNQRGEDAELSPRRPRLRPEGNEDCGGQVPGHTGSQVDHGHAHGAAQLLHVAHEVELDYEGHQKVDEAGVEEEAGQQPVELVRGVLVHERQHPTDVLHAGYLRTKRGLGVKVTVDKVAELLRSYLTLSVNAYAAGTGDSLAGHVRRGRGQLLVYNPPVTGWFWQTGDIAHGPGGNVVQPGVGVAGERCGAVQRILSTHGP